MSSTVVAVGIAVVLAVLLIAAVVAGLRAGGATRSASQRAADSGERLAASRRRLTELEAELFDVRRQLPGGRAPAPVPDPPEAPVPVAAVQAPEEALFAVDGAIPPDPSEATTLESDPNRHVIDAVWSLERLELDGQRQLDMDIIVAPVEVVDGILVGALQREVERIREEMGTPGELHNELHDDPDGPVGLLMLGAVRLTLGALARHCQAFDLRLEAGEGTLVATVVCEGFEPEAADETSAAVGAIATAVAEAGATAVFSPGVDGAARAELSFPVT
jgi:hypothetical protein